MEKLHKDSIISIDKVTAQAKYIGAVSYNKGMIRIGYKNGGYDHFAARKDQYETLVKDWKDSQSAVPEFDRLAKYAWALLKAQVLVDEDNIAEILAAVGVPENDVPLLIARAKS